MDENNRQELLIYGEKRDEILQKIMKDILSGKKNNMIVHKIIQPQVRVESYIYGLRINGFSDEEIEIILPKLNEYAKYSAKADYYEDRYSELYENGKLSKELEAELNSFSVHYEEIHSAILNFILNRQHNHNISENDESHYPKR